MIRFRLALLSLCAGAREARQEHSLTHRARLITDSQPLPAPTSYMWTAALVDASYGDSVPLHFQFSGGEGGQGLNSQSFVVLAPGKTPSASPSSSTTMQSVSDSHSTTSAPSGGVTSPSDSSAATATATGPGVDSSPQSGAQGGTTNSETLRIGLGVGLGLGIPLLLVGTGMAYFVLARWRQRAGFSPKATGSGGGSSSAYYAEQMDPYLVQDIREIDSKPVPRPPPSEIDGRGLYPRQVVHEAP